MVMLVVTQGVAEAAAQWAQVLFLLIVPLGVTGGLAKIREVMVVCGLVIILISTLDRRVVLVQVHF